MKIERRVAWFTGGLLMLAMTVAPRANADEWNQKTTFTFSGPVEIPGQVLDAGTYVFKLVDSSSDPNIVQVYNKNENHLYGTFLTIPDQRLKPAGKSIITFEERAAGSRSGESLVLSGRELRPRFRLPEGEGVGAGQGKQPAGAVHAERVGGEHDEAYDERHRAACGGHEAGPVESATAHRGRGRGRSGFRCPGAAPQPASEAADDRQPSAGYCTHRAAVARTRRVPSIRSCENEVIFRGMIQAL
jgi:hypothetical protein